MTAAQQRMIDQIREHFQHEIDEAAARDHYQEFKKWEIDDRADTPLVFLTIEIGLVGDEGTMAEIFARNYRLIAIGKRGGLHLLNGKRRSRKRSRGWFAAVHALTR